MKWTDPDYPPGWEIDVCTYMDYVCSLVPEEETKLRLGGNIPDHWKELKAEYQTYWLEEAVFAAA